MTFSVCVQVFQNGFEKLLSREVDQRPTKSHLQFPLLIIWYIISLLEVYQESNYLKFNNVWSELLLTREVCFFCKTTSWYIFVRKMLVHKLEFQQTIADFTEKYYHNSSLWETRIFSSLKNTSITLVVLYYIDFKILVYNLNFCIHFPCRVYSYVCMYLYVM